MPRRKARYKPPHIPQGVQDSVKALAIDGSLPQAQIARLYGLDPLTVKKLASEVDGIDPEHLVALRAALPGLMTILATAHGLTSLELARTDPALASKSMFSAKMAVESSRLAQAGETRPGATMMEFMMKLRVVPAAGTGSQAPLNPSPEWSEVDSKPLDVQLVHEDAVDRSRIEPPECSIEQTPNPEADGPPLRAEYVVLSDT